MSDAVSDATSTAVVVRYRTKPEAAEANEELIRRVFAALHDRQPSDLSYTVFRLEDGVSFVHVATDQGRQLPELPEFQEFQRDIAARVEIGPDAQPAGVVGAFGSFTAGRLPAE